MQQRQLRLGDILDDYCPRERRITNHAIVALVGDEIRLTRCTTCDAEHEYKKARIPPQRKKKEAPGALYQQVLSGMPRKPAPGGLLVAEPPEPEELNEPEMPEVHVASPVEAPADPEPAPVAREDDDGPVHRRLIRATLPRIEGQEPARREPDFTLRSQTPGRGRFGAFPRAGGHRPGVQHANGNHRGGGGKRHGHGGGSHRPGGFRPPGQGNRAHKPGHGNKKRSR